MIGKSVKQQYPKEMIEVGLPILEVEGLVKTDFFSNINFTLKKGEILGFAGLAGCGKSELARALFGVIPADSGKIKLSGKEISIKNVQQAMNKKIAFLPADRKVDGLFLEQSIKWNITIASMKQIIKGLINSSLENKKTDQYVSELGIKLASSKSQARSLSGGNQQKVMLARWLMTQAEILIMEEPTRGIDINAKTEVYKLLAKCVKEGKSVIIVSSESPELLGICDRILVMCEGEMTAIVDAKDADETTLARYSQSGGNNIAI
jgi:ribose transport system ATP-binding protein